MRHGQTDLNRLNKYTGVLDYPLNILGIEQCINAKNNRYIEYKKFIVALFLDQNRQQNWL